MEKTETKYSYADMLKVMGLHSTDPGTHGFDDLLKNYSAENILWLLNNDTAYNEFEFSMQMKLAEWKNAFEQMKLLKILMENSASAPELLNHVFDNLSDEEQEATIVKFTWNPNFVKHFSTKEPGNECE